ncbi:MAG: helix-turn-helix transcriptional regulator [Thermomicrobiales bacterium]|nr:helix-turn-helix transcriptional regulator [Thermomicrobiales bacterium]
MRRTIGHSVVSAQFQRVRSWRESGDNDRADAELDEISASKELIVFHRALGRWYRGRPGARQQLKETLLAMSNRAELHSAVDFLIESTGVDMSLDLTPTSLQRMAIPERQTQGIDLTEREREVLRLVAGGRTDRQIAEELFVSARTVGFHVSNILRKLDLTSRAEAAAWAARNLPA